jgi:hypothetical protein
MKPRLWRIALLLIVSGACSDAGPSVLDSAGSSSLLGSGSASAPVFPRFQAGAKPTVQQVSFWAVAGAQRELTIDYGNGTDVYLHFVVGPLSLLKRPNGSLFLPGDSVLITVTLDDSDRMIAYFEPSGLTFNPLTPARLEFSYLYANPDFDGDGDVDAVDNTLQSGLRVWKQEELGLPWLELPTLSLGLFGLSASINGFTGFGMATN